MLLARYGVEDENEWILLEEVERKGSQVLKAWWRIGSGTGKVGGLFKEMLRILVGKGDMTFFRSDLWIGDKALKEIYKTLSGS